MFTGFVAIFIFPTVKDGIILEALRNNKHIVAMEVMKGWKNMRRKGSCN